MPRDIDRWIRWEREWEWEWASEKWKFGLTFRVRSERSHGAHHQCASVITNQRSQHYPQLCSQCIHCCHMTFVCGMAQCPCACTFCITRTLNIFLFGIFGVYARRVRQSEEKQWIIARIQLNNNDCHLSLRAKKTQNLNCIEFLKSGAIYCLNLHNSNLSCLSVTKRANY